jgi:DNA-binding NarL/FixJ family response regulator
MGTAQIKDAMKNNIHVMLVEDHPEYREAIELALGKEPAMALTSQFGTAERALRHLKDAKSDETPDVILLDLNLPGMNGLDAIPLFNSAVPTAKIIILTQSDREADVLKAITRGASGYLLKSATLKQITEGIRNVNSGGASLDANVAQFILKTLKTKLPKAHTEQLLTEREMEVLTLLAEGYVKKEIADQLCISTTTVITHVTHIYEKLSVTNAPSAINKAYRMGIFPTEKEN